MKKILLAAVIACTCLQTANAQEQQRQRVASPEKMVQRMDKVLNLNDEQEKKLTALYSDFFNNKKDLKTVTPEERRAQRAEFAKKVNEVLTEDQQKKWSEIKSARVNKKTPRLHANKRDRAFSPEKAVERMDKVLGLNETQKKQLTDLYTETFNQKKTSTERGSFNRDEFHKKVNEILTADQQKKWAEIKAQQMEKRKAMREKLQK